MIRNINNLYTLIKNSKFRISFLKYFIGTAATTLVAFAIYGVISYNLYSMYLRDTTVQYRERILFTTGSFVDYVFEGMDRTFYFINNVESFDKLITADIYDFPGVREVGQTDAVVPPLLRSDISRVIADLFRETLMSPAMESIYIYMLRSSYVVTWIDFRHLDTFFDAEFLSEFRHDGNIVVRDIVQGASTRRVITMFREAGRGGHTTGVVAFNIDYEQFLSFVEQGFEHSPDDVAVADRSGRIFVSTDSALLNTYAQEHPLYGGVFVRAAQYGSAAAFEGERFVSVASAASGHYMVISSVDASEVMEFRQDFLNFVLWASVIGLLASFFLAFGVSLFLHRNIIKLVTYIGGPGGAITDSDANSEMRYITENIAGMTAGGRHIENELAEKLAELKKAQAIALQNQINPHFILNTLQIVNLDILTQMKEDTTATRIISILSEILKSNLNTTDYIVPLSYEIRQAAKYLEIERIRDNERFRVEWDIDSELEELRTVKFILQPVLENSFKHGFSNGAETEKRISITAETDGKSLFIKISDNGKGFTEETLDTLRSRLRQSFLQENNHIGLCNVDKRIKLVFGESYGVSIESSEGEGTVVIIKQKLVRADWT